MTETMQTYWKSKEINEAVTVLTDMGFVTADYLKFSDDIEKIYFSEEKIKCSI